MSIPFTQYLRPDGRRRDEAIDRSAEVEALADKFIAAGGRYECEVLTTGHVSLTAAYDVNGEQQDIAIKVFTQRPGLIGEKVDELVRESVAYIEALSR
jgi:hypothetical protein